MTERTEWPTAGKIRELRDRGIVHYSPGATACVVAAGLCFFARAASDDVGGAVERYRAALALDEVTRGWWVMLETFGSLALGGMVVVALVACGAIALQTRAFLSLGLLGLRLERLWDLSALTPGAFLRRVLGALGVVVLGAVVAALVFSLFSRDMAALLNDGVSSLEQKPRAWLDTSLPVLGGLLVLIAVPVWGVSRVRFLLRYRMTRAEVLREQGGD